MHAGGYLDRSINNYSPSRLALIAALHGVAIAALALAPPEFIPAPRWITTTIYDVPDTPPPPKPLPEKAPAKTERQAIDRPTTIVPTQIDTSGLTIFDKPGEIVIGPVEPPVVPAKTLPIITDASFIRGVEIQPDYPPALARQEIEGVVTVRVLIGTDGRVKDVQQVSASEPEFFEATRRQALRHWRFNPALRDGVPFESWRELTVRFKLQA